MDDWKKVVRWAAQEQEEEKRRERDGFKRIWRAWPMIAVAVVPFGLLAFNALNPTLVGFCTVTVLIAAVLVAENLA